jgi:hypothetical protein
MKQFYWFGGSWVSGEELDTIVPREIQQDYTYAKIVSDYYNAKCINLGVNGGGINCIPLIFSKLVDQIDADTTMFFCCPPSLRFSLFDESGVIKNILPSKFKQSHKVHDYSDKWYKYFDNSHQRIYNYDTIINLLHFWCKSLKIKHYFYNDTWSHGSAMIDATDDLNWLVDKRSCIGECILPLIDTTTRELVMYDRPSITTEEWAIQNEYIEKYIKPCWVHPNIEGHKKIAEEIIKRLGTKF